MVVYERVDDQLAFDTLCKVLNSLEKCHGRRTKKREKAGATEKLTDLFDLMRDKLMACQAAQGPQRDREKPESLYGLLRLVVPDLDSARRSYRLKEKTWVLLIIDALGVNKTSPEAQLLLNHPMPKGNKTSNDFVDALRAILRPRCLQRPRSDITIRTVNGWLNRLDAAKADEQKNIVKQCVQRLTVQEIVWLFRIIRKDMNLRLTYKTILNAFHPDGERLHNVVGDLEKVAITLADRTTSLAEIEVQLFSPFRPMLAEKISMETLAKDTKHATRLFWEIKWDGERVQMHKSGNKYEYYSRTMNGYSQSYGPNPGSGSLTQFIHDCFLPGVKNCILDGEMVCFHKDLDCIIQKGEKFDVKTLKPGGPLHPCFIVFDVIMLNDQVLTGKPLAYRYEVLFTKIFTPRHGRIRFMNEKPVPQVVESRGQISEQFNKAIENNEEGIVLKRPDSTYTPAAKSTGWYKLKPEYMDSMMDELDLIVLGGYYGVGRRKEQISQFLMGIAVAGKTGDLPKEFRTVSRVGSGLSDEVRARLSDKLLSVMRADPPESIVRGKEEHTVWFEPSESVILQIRASEIVPSKNTYSAKATLRFPRITAWREDKAWWDCMTSNEFEDMRTRSAGKLFTRKLPNYQSDTDEEDDEDSTGRRPEATRKRRGGATRTPHTVAKQFRSVDPRSVKKVSDAFNGKCFCIVNGTKEMPKDELERKVIQFGGMCSQRAEEGKIFCVVAKDDSHPRLRTYTKNGLYDVVKADWLVTSLQKGRLLPWSPLDMIAMSQKTEERFMIDYDAYGDSHTQPATMESLKYSMERVRELGHQVSPDMNDIYYPETRPEWAWNEDSKAGLFRGSAVAYFYISEGLPFFSSMARLKAMFSFCGGQVAENMHAGVSHVIFDRRDADEVPQFNVLNRLCLCGKLRLVYCSWVEECLEKHRWVPEELHAAISNEQYI